MTNAPKASAVANQMRKRTTATERNRARDAINLECFRGQRLERCFEKNYKNKVRRTFAVAYWSIQAAGAADAGSRGWAMRIF